jgi:hypothetical protein
MTHRSRRYLVNIGLVAMSLVVCLSISLFAQSSDSTDSSSALTIDDESTIWGGEPDAPPLKPDTLVADVADPAKQRSSDSIASSLTATIDDESTIWGGEPVAPSLKPDTVVADVVDPAKQQQLERSLFLPNIEMGIQE